MLRLRKYCLGLAAMACALLATSAHAYDLRPVVVQLTPSGAGAGQSMVITNSHAEPIAIEIRAFTREQNPDGSENRQPEEEDIIISPPQIVVAPGASQSIRVRWVGDPNPDRELAYRIVTEQLPINLGSQQGEDTTSANVSVTYRYEAALYVTPRDARPSAAITRAEAVRGDDGAQMLELDISSLGTRRASLQDAVVLVTPANGGDQVAIEGEAAGPLQQLVTLVGSVRTVQVPWPENLAVGPVNAELQTRYIVLQ